MNKRRAMGEAKGSEYRERARPPMTSAIPMTTPGDYPGWEEVLRDD
jgi:hypothetical protein